MAPTAYPGSRPPACWSTKPYRLVKTMPQINNDDDTEDEFSSNDAGDTAPCPYCAKEIYDDAEQCPYCGQYISGEDAPARSKQTWIVVGSLICLATAIWWVVSR